MLSPDDDAAVVAGCRRGDPEAWSELVARYSRYVYAIATQGFGLSSADAEEVFQEAFTRTYTHLSSLREDVALRPWLAQVTRRLAIDRLRESAREQPVEETGDRAVEDARLEQIDLALDVHRALQELPEHCREILDRFFARDESYRTIGEALDIPAGTIASRIARCLTKLRFEIAGKNPDSSSVP
jgi:RNA polymerase sigma-70 factor (ECF subfamily)